jgi:hypothetical protein
MPDSSSIFPFASCSGSRAQFSCPRRFYIVVVFSRSRVSLPCEERIARLFFSVPSLVPAQDFIPAQIAPSAPPGWVRSAVRLPFPVRRVSVFFFFLLLRIKVPGIDFVCSSILDAGLILEPSLPMLKFSSFHTVLPRWILSHIQRCLMKCM